MLLEDYSRQLLLSGLAILGLSIPFIALEHWFPKRQLRIRSVVGVDALHAFATVALSVPTGSLVYTLIINKLVVRGWLDFEPTLPFWILGPLTWLGIDFSLYWIHRAMHSRLLWRIHRWHHSPKHMYWLAGMRSTFFHSFLFTFNGALWATAMRIPSVWYPIGAVATVLSNNWMHTNLKWTWPRLEKWIITPRTHSLHHSVKPEHHHGNYGAFFSFWDRLFGTYVDPDKVGESVEFGIPDDVSVVRLIAGF